jgi:hypothetical protein
MVSSRRCSVIRKLLGGHKTQLYQAISAGRWRHSGAFEVPMSFFSTRTDRDWIFKSTLTFKRQYFETQATSFSGASSGF